MDWKQTAEELYKLYGRDWARISRDMASFFPENMTHHDRKESIRSYIRNSQKYRAEDGAKKAIDLERSSVEYKADGTIISEKFITIRDGDDITPEFVLEAHGLNSSTWEVVSYKNNMWNTQVSGGGKQISYQSKLTARPRVGGVDLKEIDRHFAELDRKRFVPPVIKSSVGDMMAEVNLADLHLGKMSWRGETPENYDYKIAQDVFYRIIGEAAKEISNRRVEFITFVWANDFFNSDTIDQTTTAGTRQDVDIRWQKLFNAGVEMLVRGIEILAEIAPVKTFYTPSNHDEVTGYHALKYLEAWFRNNPNVEIDTSAYPRKYQLYGNTLIGYCHGDKENSTGSREKASRLASLMPLEAAQLWGQSLYREMHTAHLHSEQMIQEINGVIVRRIASPTALDTWHTTSGYIGAVRKAQLFLYDADRGLVQTVNIPV